RTYIWLLVVFIVFSFVGGWATTMGMVVTARVFQGAMTGVIRPLALDALFMVSPPEKRGMATAIYGMSLSLRLTLATVIGGYFVEQFSWRYGFFSVLPLCVVAIFMALVFLPEREESGPLPRLDWVGALVLFAVVFLPLAAI